MRGINICVIGGNLGKDPEIKFTQGGVSVVKFPLALNSKDKEKKDITQWFNVVAFAGLAEICEPLSKGDEVVCHGSFVSRSWENDNGQKQTVYELHAREIIFVSVKKWKEKTQ